MSTPCQGCKALVVQTADDYNVYSLQRALYPVNPLMIIPQPNSWVDHVCEDGFVVHRLYTQGEDWTTFWQQVSAECANHTVPIDPIVISDPNTETGGTTTPAVDPNTKTNDDPVPGPDDVITPPPVVPPPPGDPIPAPNYGPMGWPWTPPNPPYPPYPPGTPNPWIPPAIPPLCHYGVEYNFTYSCSANPDAAEKAIAWAAIYVEFFIVKAVFPHLYMSFSYETLRNLDPYHMDQQSLVITAVGNRLICSDDPPDPFEPVYNL